MRKGRLRERESVCEIKRGIERDKHAGRQESRLDKINCETGLQREEKKKY